MATRMMPPGMGSPSAAPEMPKQSRMPPPGAMDKPQGDGKVSPEEAGVYRADQTCVQCGHYDPTSGECEKVSGNFDPSDGCVKYFEAIGSDEPDDDETGGAEDNDADDAGGMR